MARKNNRSTKRALRDLLHPDNSDPNMGGSQRQSTQPMVFKGSPLRDMLHPEPKSLIKQAMDFGRSNNAGRQMQTAPSPPQVQRPTFTVPDPLDVNLFPLETTGWRTPPQASTKIDKTMPKPSTLTLQQQTPPSDLQIRLREIANRKSSGPTDMHPFLPETQAPVHGKASVPTISAVTDVPDKPQMGWGDVIGKSLAAGTTQAGASAVNIPRMIHRGAAHLTDFLLPEALYDMEQDPLIQAGDRMMQGYDERIAKQNAELAQLTGIKEFVSRGLRPIPQVVLSALAGLGLVAGAKLGAGAALTVGTGAALAAGKGAFIRAYPQVARMIPFGTLAAGGAARQAELDGAPYTKQVLTGVLVGGGEMIAESIPFGYALRAIDHLGVDNLVEQGARNMLKQYGAAGINFLKAGVTEAMEEAVMAPWGKFVEKSVYNPDMPMTGPGGVFDVEPMIQAGVGGVAMSVVLGALGLPATTASYIRAQQAIRNNEKMSDMVKDLEQLMPADLAELEQQLASGAMPEGQIQSSAAAPASPIAQNLLASTQVTPQPQIPVTANPGASISVPAVPVQTPAPVLPTQPPAQTVLPPVDVLAATVNPAAPKPPRFGDTVQVGQKVKLLNKGGEAFTVTDVSDRSLVKLRSDKGTEFQAGRVAILEYVEEQPAAKPEVEPPKVPAFVKGDHVSWKDRSGKTITGTIQHESSVGNFVGYMVKADSEHETTFAGGVPIGRQDLVSARALTRIGDETPTEAQEEMPEKKPVENLTGTALEIAKVVNSEETARKIMQEFEVNAMDGWRGNIFKERLIKQAIHQFVPAPDDVEKVFAILNGGQAETAEKPAETKTERTLNDYGLRLVKSTTKTGKPVWNLSGETKQFKEALGRSGAGGSWYGPAKVWSFYGEEDPTSRILEALPKHAPEEKLAHPSVKIAEFVKGKLAAGEKFSNAELYRVSEEAYGGTMAANVLTIKDAYDAMELGVNKYLLENPFSVGPVVGVQAAAENVARLEELLSLLPTQGNRITEQDKWQQFSTPPNLAYIAAWTASPTRHDVVLEPSAGIGGLAVFARLAGEHNAEVIVNEYSERRAVILKEMGFDRVFTEDATQLDNVLPDDVKPTLVIMNPPFSSAGDRNLKGMEIGARHVEQALKRLEPGGRLVAIVGRGMAEGRTSAKSWWDKIKKEYRVLANVGIDGKNYRKYGTTFDVQLLVIDKIGPTTGRIVTGEFESLVDVIKALEGTKNERIEPAQTSRPAEQAPHQQTGQRPAGEGQQAARPASVTPSQPGGDGTVRPANDTGGTRTADRPGGVSADAESQEGAGFPTQGRPGTGGQVGGTGSAQGSQRRSNEDSPLPGAANQGNDSVQSTGATGTVEKNAKVTKEWAKGAAAEARARLQARREVEARKQAEQRDLTFSDTAPKSLPMNDLVDYSVIGMDLLLENPDMSYDKFAAEMIAEFGASLRLFTRAIYAQAQALTEMAPADIEEMLGLTQEQPQEQTPKQQQPERKPQDKPVEKKPAAEHQQEEEHRPEKADDIKVSKTETQRTEEVLSDSIFDDYKPQIKITGSQAHPAPLAESAAMATVQMPGITASLALPKKLIKEGILSGVQLEPIAYAEQAFQTTLPGGQRKGFLCGDGTGVGKGRIIAGTILNSFHKGQKKAVWVSKNADLFVDAKRDWVALGGDPKKLVELKSLNPKTFREGIVFVPYPTLAMGFAVNSSGEIVEVKGTTKSRLKQLLDWLGKDYEGVVAFDEAHMMRNILGKDPAEMALAGVELQRRVPKARVFYASATAATEVENLAYAQRLGLWGEGTAFANENEFVSQIASGGLAAMEVVSRDMKALGVYLSRTLSFDGIEYDRLVHELTPEQTEIYDAIAEGWQVVLQNIDEALEITGANTNARAKRYAYSRFWSSQLRFYSQVLTSMQMPSVLETVKKDIAEGKAVVLQLVNTNAAIQDRKIAGMEEDQTLDDLDLTPKDVLMELVDNAFPVQEYEGYLDENGNKKTRPVFDSQGKPVISREALRKKEALLERLGSIKVPDGPLEMLLNTFGSDKVAEITGRKQRVVRVYNDETGRIEPKLERRSDSSLEADVNAFMDDKKHILVFSDKGGTGKSYHADKTKKNQRQRIHYLLQAGWKADAAVQGFGRSHRSNQVSAPMYRLVTTNLKGHARFISTIARRLDQLGALTRGQRQTGSQGLFSEKDNLEGPMARDAMYRFYHDLIRGDIDGLNGEETLRRLGLYNALIDQETRSMKKDPEAAFDVPRFLNRILALPMGEQNRIFDEFSARLEAMIEIAIARGTMDTGLENYRADSVTIKSQQVVYTHPDTGAETTYYELEVGDKNVPVPFEKAANPEKRILDGFYRNARSKRVYAAYRVGTETDQYGRIAEKYLLQGRSERSIQTVTRFEINEGNWEKLTKGEAALAWEEGLASLPEFATRKVHLISGALLPIWDRLPSGQMRVIRVKTNDNQVLLGRLVGDQAIDRTLRKLGAGRNLGELTPKRIAEMVYDQNYTAMLANGWRIVKRRVSGETRIEIVGDLFRHAALLQKEGVFSERIQWDVRYFIPTGERAVEVMENVIRHRPIAEMIAPATQEGDLAFSPALVEKVNQALKNRIEEARDLSFAERHAPEKTSIKQIAAGLRRGVAHNILQAGTVNLDLGGGLFDEGSKFLSRHSVENLVYDPYARSPEHNAAILERLADDGGADSVTLNNTLNVIPTDGERRSVLEFLYQAIKPGGKAIITIYEGNGSGVGKKLSHPDGTTSWQENRKRATYEAEIKAGLPNNATVEKKAGIFVITKPVSGSLYASTTQTEVAANRELAFTGLGKKKTETVVTRSGVAEVKTQAKQAFGTRDVIHRRQMLRELFDILDTPFRTGRIKKRKALGTFDTHDNVIRALSKFAEDPRVLFHEAGHWMDKFFDWDLSNSNQFDNELLATPYVVELQQANPTASLQALRKEGAGEFFWFFLSDPSDAQTNFPRFYESFMDKLRQHPDMFDALLNFQEIYSAYQAQDPVSKVLSAQGRTRKESFSFSRFTMRVKAALLDDLAPLDHFAKAITDGEALKTHKDPYRLSRLARGSAGRAYVLIFHGQYVWEGGVFKKVGPSLKELADDAGEDFAEFTAYLIAKRAQELEAIDLPGLEEEAAAAGIDRLDAMKRAFEKMKGTYMANTSAFAKLAEEIAKLDAMALRINSLKKLKDRNITSGIDMEAAKQVVEMYKDNKKFNEHFEKWVGWWDFLIEDGIKAGTIGREEATIMRQMHQFYVPFKRVRDDDEAFGFGSGGNTYGDLPDTIKAIHGSGRSIQFVWEQAARDAYLQMSVNDRARAIRALVNLGKEHDGMGRFMEEVKTKTKVTTFSLWEIADAMEKAGVNLKDENRPVDLSRTTQVFDASRWGTPSENTIVVMNNGQAEFWRLDRDLYRAVMALDEESMTMLGKLMRPFAQLLRAGATLNPRFIAVNPFRDQFWTGTFVKEYRPFLDFGKGVASIVGKDDWYVSFMHSGAALSALANFDEYRHPSFKVHQEAKMKETLRAFNPINLLFSASTAMEQATKIGVFRLKIQAGWTPEAAAFAAREAPVDFAVRGHGTKTLRTIIPFFNAALQSQHRMIRGFKDDPIRTLLRALLWITIPTILLYLLNRKNPYYHELPLWRKDGFWNIPVPGSGGESFVSMPIPFTLGYLFKAFPERVLAAIDQDDPNALEGFGSNLLKMMLPNYIPALILPFIEDWANMSTFTGRAIVPTRERFLEPFMQYGPHTSEVSKLLGRIWNISPRRVDNFIFGYTAGLGRLGVQVIDKGLELAGLADTTPNAAEGIRGIPILGDFIAEPGMGGTATIDRFYKDYTETKQLYDSLRRRYEAGEPAPQDLTARQIDMLSVYDGMKKLANELSKLRAVIREVYVSREMTPEEKRKTIDAIEMQMLNLVRQAYGKTLIVH